MGEMWILSLDDVSAGHKGLHLQAEELRETLASLESQNQELLHKKESMGEQRKGLQEAVGHLKDAMEHLHGSLEAVTQRLDRTNVEIHQSELQKKYLRKHHEELSEDMHAVASQVSSFQDSEAASEKDLEEMRNLVSRAEKDLRSLEDVLAETGHNHRLEKIHSGQLTGKVAALQRLREARRNQARDLQEAQEICVQQALLWKVAQENQTPKGWLLPEIVEAKLRRVAGGRSETREALDWLWGAAKILFMVLFGCFPFLGLILAYTHFCHPCFIAEMLLAVLSHQDVEQLADSFSPYLEFRSDGLLPF